MRIRSLAIATSSVLALAALLATGAAARRPSARPGPDFRQACSAPPRAWAGCLALERTNVVSYSGISRNATPAGYSPAALQSAYGLTQASAAAGRGQTVAVVEAYHDPSAAANLAVYRAQFRLPPCTAASGCLRQVNQNGAASPLPRPAGTTGWAAEESVDLDMVSAICPLHPRIDIYRCSRGRAQVWLVSPQPDGTVQIRLVKAARGACLTASRRVTLRRCSGPGQAWRAGPGGHLISPRSGLCLTDPGAGPSGTRLDLTRCASAAAERWNLP